MFFDLHRMLRAGENERVREILRKFHTQRFYLRHMFEDEKYRLSVNPLQYFGPGHVRVQFKSERQRMRPSPERLL